MLDDLLIGNKPYLVRQGFTVSICITELSGDIQSGSCLLSTSSIVLTFLTQPKHIFLPGTKVEVS